MKFFNRTPKIKASFGMTIPGFSWDGLGFDSKEKDDE